MQWDSPTLSSEDCRPCVWSPRSSWHLVNRSAPSPARHRVKPADSPCNAFALVGDRADPLNDGRNRPVSSGCGG